MLPATMTREEVLSEIVLRPRLSYVPLPDMQIIERPGWRQLITPSVKRGGFNEVSFAQLADDQADAVIDAAIAQYKALGIGFVWRVGPDSSPHLPAKLAARGLEHGVSCGMARSTDVAAVDGVRIERVDASTVDAFTTTMAAGWGVDPEPLFDAHRATLQTTAHHLYLAYCDGEPAATGGSVMFERSVYLFGGVTLARFRGRQLYRALVAARLAHARDLGIPLATTHARADTSAPILERLGFETLCHYDNYRSR